MLVQTALFDLHNLTVAQLGQLFQSETSSIENQNMNTIHASLNSRTNSAEDNLYLAQQKAYHFCLRLVQVHLDHEIVLRVLLFVASYQN